MKQRYVYSRKDHLKSEIARLQGKETIAIPQTIIHQVAQDIAAKKSLASCTLQDVRDALAAKRDWIHYRYAARIWASVTGKPPPTLSEQEELECYKKFDMSGGTLSAETILSQIFEQKAKKQAE